MASDDSQGLMSLNPLYIRNVPDTKVNTDAKISQKRHNAYKYYQEDNYQSKERVNIKIVNAFRIIQIINPFQNKYFENS